MMLNFDLLVFGFTSNLLLPDRAVGVCHTYCKLPGASELLKKPPSCCEQEVRKLLPVDWVGGYRVVGWVDDTM